MIPLFAINPSAIAVSSTLYPSAPATGAAYLNDSPNIDTLVFEVDEAAASTSAKCVAFATSFEKPSLITVVVPLADKPKAVMASVTISDVVARFSPEAAARFIMPSMPFNMSLVRHPAIAMYSIASPDSVAENFVFAPISLAFSPSFSTSSLVAPEIAPTFDICASKSAVVLMDAVATPTIAVVTADIF